MTSNSNTETDRNTHERMHHQIYFETGSKLTLMIYLRLINDIFMIYLYCVGTGCCVDFNSVFNKFKESISK